MKDVLSTHPETLIYLLAYVLFLAALLARAVCTRGSGPDADENLLSRRAVREMSRSPGLRGKIADRLPSDYPEAEKAPGHERFRDFYVFCSAAYARHFEQALKRIRL